MKMRSILCLGLLSSMFLGVCGDDGNLNEFIADILSTFSLASPTIVFDEIVPEVCTTHQWVLCVSNALQSEQEELADHIAWLSLNRRQDSIIFVGGGETHTGRSNLILHRKWKYSIRCLRYFI